SLLAGVRELPPGCCLRWRDGSVALRRYWDVAEAAAKKRPPVSVDEAKSCIRAQVVEIVKKQAADGVSSACVVPGDVETSLLAALLGRQSVSVTPCRPLSETAALAWITAGGPWTHDEPLADPAVLRLIGLEQQSAGPLFSATGADEVFATRPFYR